MKDRKKYRLETPEESRVREEAAKKFASRLMRRYHKACREMGTDQVEILVNVEEGTYRMGNMLTGEETEIFKGDSNHLTKKYLFKVLSSKGFSYEDNVVESL